MLDESIFDFDGTLYQGEEISRTFLHCVLEEIGREDLFATAWETAQLISSGDHGCRVGGYFPLTDPPGAWFSSRVQDYARHLKGIATAGDGTAQDGFPVPGAGSHRIGDGWGVVFAVAEPLVADITVFHRSFRKMRQRVASSPSPLPGEARLRDTLQRLRADHRLILFSNSLSGPDANALLDRLGIEDLFHEVRFEAGKPQGMKERIRGLTEDTGVSPESVVSIGDHPWNDLYPAWEAGAHTVLVSPYADLDRPEWSHRVAGVEELLTLLAEEWALGAA